MSQHQEPTEQGCEPLRVIVTTILDAYALGFSNERSLPGSMMSSCCSLRASGVRPAMVTMVTMVLFPVVVDRIMPATCVSHGTVIVSVMRFASRCIVMLWQCLIGGQISRSGKAAQVIYASVTCQRQNDAQVTEPRSEYTSS